MMLSIKRPDCEYIERPSALITPAVTLARKPNGFPIAIASCPVNDVAVGQDETVRSNHEARAISRDFARLVLTSLLDRDVNHRRRDALDRAYNCARVFVQQGRIGDLCCRLIMRGVL